VLLLDEPTGPLDPQSTRRVEELIMERMAAGLTCVVVTHDLGLPSRLGAQHRGMVRGQLGEP
jgi:ABC-type phosphate transport system ATPase subunit